MYKEIFKDGVTDEAINKACNHALQRVVVGIEYREAIRRTTELYYSHGIMLVEENKSSVTKYFREKSGYDYLKVNPITKLPPRIAGNYLDEWLLSVPRTEPILKPKYPY
jgi:hypothetical protein